MSMADEMDVPPLEDLSSVLQTVLCSKYIRTDNGSCSRWPVTTGSDSCTADGRISLSVSEIYHLIIQRFCYGTVVTYAALFKH